MGWNKVSTVYKSPNVYAASPTATQCRDYPMLVHSPHVKATLGGAHPGASQVPLAFPLTLTVTCPWIFSISPSMADIKEDFPEPTVPTTATNGPGIMSRFTLKERTRLDGGERTYLRVVQAT